MWTHHLSESGGRSRAGGLVYLTNKDAQMINAPIHHSSTILPTVVASAAEAEYGAMFILLRETIPLRRTLIELGHPQPATLITCDNTVAVRIANDNCKQKLSRSLDMRYHYSRDQVKLGNFQIKWRTNHHSLADILTKIHPKRHSIYMRQFLL